MKYKEPILTRINGVELQLKYVIKNINSTTISPQDAIDNLKQALHKLQSIRDLVEAE